MIDTSTAVLARLFVRLEGGGEMLGSVPSGLGELATRLSEPSVYGDRFGRTRMRGQDRITFLLKDGVAKYVKDLREVPEAALRKDREGLKEVLLRAGLSGWPAAPLLREEFDYLFHCLGDGAWLRYTGFIVED